MNSHITWLTHVRTGPQKKNSIAETSRRCHINLRMRSKRKYDVMRVLPCIQHEPITKPAEVYWMPIAFTSVFQTRSGGPFDCSHKYKSSVQTTIKCSFSYEYYVIIASLCIFYASSIALDILLLKKTINGPSPMCPLFGDFSDGWRQQVIFWAQFGKR